MTRHALKPLIGGVLAVVAVVFAVAHVQAKEPKVPTGYLVFSIESDQKRETNQQLTVRRHGGTKTWLINTPGLWGTKYNFSTMAGAGSVMVKELPQGDYVAVTLTSRVDNSVANVPIEVPFMIEGGKATYLGAFRPTISVGKGWFGSEIPQSVSYALFDERARDLPLAADRLPAGIETLADFAGYAE